MIREYRVYQAYRDFLGLKRAWKVFRGMLVLGSCPVDGKRLMPFWLDFPPE